jgi:hypothetical protein
MSKVRTKFFCFLSLFVALAAGAVSLARTSGPGCGGGGGGGFFVGGHFELLDFYNIDPEFKEPKPYKDLPASRVGRASIAPFVWASETDMLSADQAYQLAQTILKPWSELPFDIVGTEMAHLFDPPLQWLFVDEVLNAPPVFIPSALSKNTKVFIAAYYDSTQMSETVHISRSLWNQMDVYNQSGLLIHEGLRELQIAWGADFSDESLQKATAIVMLCQPSVKLNQYIFYMLQNQQEQAQKAYGDFSAVTVGCRGFQP